MTAALCDGLTRFMSHIAATKFSPVATVVNVHMTRRLASSLALSGFEAHEYASPTKAFVFKKLFMSEYNCSN